MGREIEAHHGGQHRGRRRDKNGLGVIRRDTADVGKRRFDDIHPARLGIEQRQAPCGLAVERAHDAPLRGKGIGGHAEDPLRQTEFRFHRRQGLYPSGTESVQIPPVAAVGNKIKRAVGREGRLKNRFVPAPGYTTLVTECSTRRDIRQPQFGTIPRHVRMVPCQPCQMRTIRTQARGGVEVMSRNQADGLAAAIEINGHDRIDRLAAGAVIFAHAYDALTP